MAQVDLSLGFTKIDKFPLYINSGPSKGTGDITLILNNDGLRGKGKIDYLTSVTASKDFIFYIDSMKTNSQTFNIEHNAMGIYPKVTGTNNFVEWRPYRDTMIIWQKNKPFYIYEKQIEFSGNLVLTPAKLTSRGTFAYRNSDITSNNFIFTPTKLLSDTATVKIKSVVENVYSFLAPKVGLDLDVEKDILTGESTLDNFKIQLPINKYVTSQKKFTWYMNEQKIDLAGGKNQTDKDLWYLSVDPRQDSLKFNSLKSTYDLAANTIFAYKVPYIPVADARIYPDSNEVTIFKDAQMKSLSNAEIKVDTIHYYHRIYKAFVNVFSKNKYTGYGTYDYVDKYKKKQPVFFYQIRVDETKRTLAKGKIADTTVFFLSPHFRFYGDVELNGNMKEMNYDGFVLPYHKIASVRSTWFAVQSRINPDSIIFTINKPKDISGKDLFTGVYMTIDSPYVYNIFLGRLRLYNDQHVLESNKGVLFYDDKKESFILADPDKVFNNERRGNYFALNNKTGDVFAEGKIDLGEENKILEFRSAGDITYTAADNKFIFDMLMTIHFPFDNNALKKMTSQIIETAFNRKDTKEQRNVIKNAVAELIDNDKERKSSLRQLDEGTLLTPEKTLAQDFCITEMQLTWDMKSKSFLTAESKIGINSINKASISKMMDGGFQIAKRRSGMVFNFYIQPDQNSYYYFKYSYGQFSVLSSDMDFNNIVRGSATKFSQPKFRIDLASSRDMERFKNLINIK